MIKWDLFQRYKDGSISANSSMLYTMLTKLKDKNYMMISVDAEKELEKNNIYSDKNSHQHWYRESVS